MSKLTQKDLKQPDEFVSIAARLAEHLSKHRLRYLALGGAVLVAAIAAVVVQHLLDSRSDRLSQQYATALETYRAPVGGTPGPETPVVFATEAEKDQKSLELFDAMIGDNPGSGFATFARFYKGNILFKQGRYREAVDQYNDFLSRSSSPFSELRRFAYLNIGKSYESLKEYDRALESYRTFIDQRDNFMKDHGFFLSARVHEKKGEGEKAAELYRRLVDEFKDSELKAPAERRLAEITAPKQAG